MDKDVEAIGHHCEYTYCNQLDFLPFRCESCRHTFCLDHRTETAHECAHAGAWAAARRRETSSSPSTSSTTNGKPTPATGQQCSHPTCKTYINTLSSVGVGCATCSRQYCLKHRLREDHACNTLAPLGARPASAGPTQAQKAQAALSRLRLWGKEKAAAAAASSPHMRPAPKPSSAAAKAVALTAIRKNAKGDAKIPVEKRIYLHVEAEAATTTSKLPRGDFFYHRDWSVGRMLDEAARGLQVQNVNNRGVGEEQRLRVFHVEGGRLLEFGEKVGEGVGMGNTVVLLRGVGPAVPDLIAG
jgi:predicted nucleic acid binding AN1-type Zn finger protein